MSYANLLPGRQKRNTSEFYAQQAILAAGSFPLSHGITNLWIFEF